MLLAWGLSAALAAYLPTIVVGLMIVVLEFNFPEHSAWRPRWSDVKADAAFIGVVQIALPQALAALSVIALASWMHRHVAHAWWPHGWPLWAQVAIVVLAVDFMRYWLHRACHRYLPLWKLHEVHHSPEILYVLNVGRFHPLEKTLHFALDTAPFLIIGVAPEVIAGYFLMYSVNGLFQHSNVRLRHGWLNYIAATAETHRWHHARDPQTAACNFSNTTIVWDLLFGTWRLHPNQAASNVGIPDESYPESFWSQMLSPFRHDAVAEGVRFRRWFVRPFQQLHAWGSLLLHVRRINANTRDPMKVQRALLREIIQENRHTTFGRQHGFEAIKNIDEFVQRVPVRDYEGLRPFIDAEIKRGENALTAENPQHYVRTSGTTGKPKDIPLTPSHLRALRKIHRLSLLLQQRACPRAFAGSILGIVGAANEGVLSNGKPVGSASGIVAGDTPALVRQQFVVPPVVFSIGDHRVKYLLILRLALARRDVTYLGSGNPTTPLALIKLYREFRGPLLDDLRRGTFFRSDELTPEIRRAIKSRLRANPQRASELEKIGGAARIADLWPDLCTVSTWTCASAGIAVEALRRELAPRTRILELGYISSEFRGTVTLGRTANGGLPTFDAHYFEFVERDRWDCGEPEFLTLDRVRKGIPYYVVVTTRSGLYRYFINDVVVISGFFHKTPLLKFLQKGRGVTSITGEKLYEAQVLAAVNSVMMQMGRGVRFMMMLADEVAARYLLYIEPDPGPRSSVEALGQAVDLALQKLNVEYAAKRGSDRLHAPIAAWLRAESGEAYKQFCLQHGQREGQFKTVCLARRNGFGFDFDPLVDTASS